MLVTPNTGSSSAVQSDVSETLRNAAATAVKHARAAVIANFVAPSSLSQPRSKLDPSSQLESLELLCPDVSDRVANMYVSFAAMLPLPRESGANSTARSWRLPLLALLIQRWVYKSTGTWIPGMKFDEWYCRRLNPQRAVSPVLSPRFAECEIALCRIPCSEESRQFLFPFRGRAPVGIAVKLIRREKTGCRGPPLTGSDLQPFLMRSWCALRERINALIPSNEAASPIASADYDHMLSRGEEFLRMVVDSSQRLSSPAAASNTGKRKHRIHLEALYSSSVFDLAGTCVFLAAKEECRREFGSRVQAAAAQNDSAELMSRFHADCLTNFNHCECDESRTAAILDSAVYFLSLHVKEAASDSAPSTATKGWSANRSSIGLDRLTGVSFLPIRQWEAPLESVEPLFMGNWADVHLSNSTAIEKFKSAIAVLTESDDGIETEDGIQNSTRDSITSWHASKNFEQVALPLESSQSSFLEYLRTTEEKDAKLKAFMLLNE